MDRGTERILALMREKGIRSITEHDYKGDGKMRTLPVSDYDKRGGMEWLEDRVDEIVTKGQERK